MVKAERRLDYALKQSEIFDKLMDVVKGQVVIL